MKQKVLLVEDEATLAMIIADMLTREGFEVAQAGNGEDGISMFLTRQPDAVVADVMMPRLDGFGMVRRIRAINSEVPVIFLTAKSAIDDIVEGFELGANDYLKKPFRMEELLVRLKSLLRRVSTTDGILRVGNYTFNPATQVLSLGDKNMELSHIETVLLRLLASNINHAVEARTMMMAIWQNDDPYNLNRLHGFIHKLRKYLAADPSVSIMNIRGIGYKLRIG